MKKISITISTLASLFLFVSAALLFACAPMEDGTYMNCHKANVAVSVIACLLVIAGILSLLIRARLASVLLSGIMVLASILSAIVPGTLVHLCMMPEMTCRALFRPVDIICSVIIAVFSAIVFGLSVKKEK